eukprot:15438271-Alexandrium_andersonii.AAC.1
MAFAFSHRRVEGGTSGTAGVGEAAARRRVQTRQRAQAQPPARRADARPQQSKAAPAGRKRGAAKRLAWAPPERLATGAQQSNEAPPRELLGHKELQPVPQAAARHRRGAQ